MTVYLSSPELDVVFVSKNRNSWCKFFSRRYRQNIPNTYSSMTIVSRYRWAPQTDSLGLLGPAVGTDRRTWLIPIVHRRPAWTIGVNLYPAGRWSLGRLCVRGAEAVKPCSSCAVRGSHARALSPRPCARHPRRENTNSYYLISVLTPSQVSADCCRMLESLNYTAVRWGV